LLPINFAAIAIWNLSLLAQEEAARQPSAIGKILENPLTLVMGLVFLFYFIVLMPERRRKAEEAKMVSAIKKNDRIVTVGGIHGTVVAAPPESNVVTIRIDENSNTRIKINRSAIASVVSDKESQAAGNKEAATETKDR
jgi:preprotein translocase subunit YajC